MRSHQTFSALPFTVDGMGAVRIMVKKEDLEKAKKILADYKHEEDEDDPALRNALAEMCRTAKPPKKLLVAPKQYCTDNAVMVASLAYYKYKAGLFAELSLEPKATS